MGKGKPRWPEEEEDTPIWTVPAQWLEKPVDLAVLDEEIKNLAERLNWYWKGKIPEQAGAHLAELQRFRARIGAGDELWSFRSPQEDWDRLMGLARFVFVREDKPVAAIVTKLN